MNCADCDEQDCYQGKDCTTHAAIAAERARAPEAARVMAAAASIEAEGYGAWTRIEEVAHYAHATGVERLGIAFCVGLIDEARLLKRYYRAQGFCVYTACCKLGAIDKETLGLARLHPDWDHEATCSPIGQALELQRCRTELNVAVGLCVGHDVLFNRHSHAPVTTLVVKDRVLGHQPLAALYTRYGRKRLGVD